MTRKPLSCENPSRRRARHSDRPGQHQRDPRNGHPVQMRVLQYGDQLTIGRCLLIYGSQEQIADAYKQHQRSGNTLSRRTPRTTPSGRRVGPRSARRPKCRKTCLPAARRDSAEPPPFRKPRSPKSGLHARANPQDGARILRGSGRLRPKYRTPALPRMTWDAWQRLLNLEMQLAVYLRTIAEPH